MAKREVRQCFEGVTPRKTGTKGVQEGVEGRWVVARWGMPKYASNRERVSIHRVQDRQSRGREAEQVLVQGQALLEAPFPDHREGGRAMNK